MATTNEIPSAAALARRTDRHFPGESRAYREARVALLVEEIDLRRHLERVAALPDILQRVAFAVVARAPIERLAAFAAERGWRHPRLYSSGENRFNQDYAAQAPNATEDNPAFNVFHRDGSLIRHFWGDEMGGETADPGQDPRGAPDPMPIWNILYMTPEGRGSDWRPSPDHPQP
jgi:predicted dithiol-disulfide oxidoreductase (DUF899 family)